MLASLGFSSKCLWCNEGMTIRSACKDTADLSKNLSNQA